MSEFLGSIWWLLVALGLLITFHEFGHFWVARLMGVRVLKFSIGFGPELFGITKEIEARARESVKTLVAQEEFGGDLELDRDPESEEIEDSEDEVDYGDPDVEE